MTRISVLMAAFLFLHLAPTAAQNVEQPDYNIVVFDVQRLAEDFQLSSPKDIASSPVYENQPAFLPNSQDLYFTRIKGENADIWQWSETLGAVPWSASSLGEYSPTPMPGKGLTLSTVRVEEDGTQRLWSFLPETGFQLIFETIKPVGYHLWYGNQVFLFVLGEPHELRLAKLGQETSKLIDSNIGRCLQAVPDLELVSYTVEQEGEHKLKTYDLQSGEILSHRLLPSKTQDYVWWDSQTLITSKDGTLVWGKRFTDSPWNPILLPGGFKISEISRLAISPDKKRLALVYLK